MMMLAMMWYSTVNKLNTEQRHVMKGRDGGVGTVDAFIQCITLLSSQLDPLFRYKTWEEKLSNLPEDDAIEHVKEEPSSMPTILMNFVKE